MPLPPQLQTLLQGLHHIEVTRYTQMASTCIILYDHLLTFDDEVELIWKASWSMGKGMFLINRYHSVASVIFMNYGFFSPTLTPSFCNQFFQWQGWTGLIACIVAEVILQMRFVLAKITATTVNIPNGKFCMPHGVSDKFYIFWVPMLAFECLLCTLALIRGFQAFVSDGSLFRRGRELVQILLRDSVLYFLVICATYMTCLLVWIVGPVRLPLHSYKVQPTHTHQITLLEVPIGFSVAMSCVLANRHPQRPRSQSHYRTIKTFTSTT
ncbi:hypothetical protein FA13DRAFT_478427 [Coprinellus micaceus]|uniref:DUF6533 domain-containing protein n=1 Tax=Coprinellus micaceus TaxID=71717 RepID=A0A4Y7TAP0_COPMI|nr:hypothetical protein FA13DRAFT_478427 [Coprinellus micaceus]